MASVEYLKSTAQLQESILNCESERLNLEQKLKALKSGSGGATSTALSGYYQDLCQRETSMHHRAQQLLADLERAETTLRSLDRRAGQLRAKRDAILAEHGPRWRDDIIDYLRRQTSTESLEKSAPPAAASGASTGANLATRGSATLRESSGLDTSSVPPLNLSQLSRSGGASTAAAKAAASGGGGGWNTSGALLGLTESTMDSTGFSKSGSQLGDTARQKTPRGKTLELATSNEQQQQQQQPRPPPAPAPSTTKSATTDSVDSTAEGLSDLTLTGLHCLLDFVDSEMKRAQPRILAGYYATSAPSDALRAEICSAANSGGGLPSHVSAVSATALLLEELDLLVATRLPGGCVFTEQLVSALSGVSDPRQLDRQIDMNIGDAEARSLWRRLLRHMRRLKQRTGRSALDVARLFCPSLLPQSSPASVSDRLVNEAVRILNLPAGGNGEDLRDIDEGEDDDDDDEESVTIASDRRPQPKPQPEPQRPVVGESMQATAGSFVEEADDEEDEDDDNGGFDVEIAGGGKPAAAVRVGGGDSLNVTGNPELRASSSDSHVRAYAAALQDDSADESSITELTMQSGTNRSGFFSHDSPQPNLKGSNAYQKLLQGALGASANLNKSFDDQTTPTSKAPAAPAGSAARSKEPQVESGDKLWSPQPLANKDDNDLESDIDSELENSFRLRLSGGGTLKSHLTASGQVTQQKPPPTHAEDEDEDFGGFYD
ncbi:hypothetical protein BOX15_Mlig015471g2 [Macrostomum lignano]|uniref:Centrosomal protein kizuna n=1 Tax=Macrostomum lignano TaxID=282301 RepID=A0A267G5J9_9PLAT|nr:hypothetical protein BOX15_Mlig015471g2 [Macrostomum lignano]